MFKQTVDLAIASWSTTIVFLSIYPGLRRHGELVYHSRFRHVSVRQRPVRGMAAFSHHVNQFQISSHREVIEKIPMLPKQF